MKNLGEFFIYALKKNHLVPEKIRILKRMYELCSNVPIVPNSCQVLVFGK